MSSKEFSRWQVIFRERPWGFDVDNWRMGQLCSVVANFSGNIDPKKLAKPTDFYQAPK